MPAAGPVMLVKDIPIPRKVNRAVQHDVNAGYGKEALNYMRSMQLRMKFTREGQL